MFNSKKENLDGFQKTSVETKSDNSFLQAGLKNAAETRSGNGSRKYSTTGNPLVDQFGKTSDYKSPRDFSEISSDMSVLWSEDPLNALKFTLFMRMITRQVGDFDGEKTQARGLGLRYEAMMRMLWLAQKSPETFYQNLPLFVAVGSWKDMFEMMRMDLMYHGWDDKILDFDKMSDLIISGLNSDSQVDLVKKFMPTLKSRKQCRTVRSQANNLIAKFLCNKLFGSKEGSSTYQQYRQLKSSGTAHQWQQLISQGQHDLIDFDQIHGRALMLISRSKYLDNQNLKKKYEDWITDPETKDVKITGFVHELFQPLSSSRNRINHVNPVTKAQEETINKQFATLVKKAGEKEQTRMIVVRDTSSSMGSPANGAGMSCFDVAKALALYFSEFLEGPFAGSFYEFDGAATLHKWRGSTPVEKWINDKCEAYGSTEFQSIIQDMCRIKRSGVSESEFPTGILCLSDGMFNPTQLDQTNVDAARTTLRSAGFSQEYCDNFVIVLWNLSNNYYGHSSSNSVFETYGNVPNVFYFSGFSASIIGFLTDKIKTPAELVEAALSQPILEKAEIK